MNKDDIIQDLVRAEKEVEEKGLSISDYKEHGKYNIQSVIGRFGSWNEALKQAGVHRVDRSERVQSAESPNSKMTKEELKEEIEKGKSLTEIAEENDYSGMNVLSERISRYDWEIKNKLTMPSDPQNNCRILSLKASDIEEAGFEPDNEDLYYSKKIKNGKIILDISEDRVEG